MRKHNHDASDMFEYGNYQDEPLLQTTWVDALIIAAFVAFGIALAVTII